jgi:uncharacterized protein YegL
MRRLPVFILIDSSKSMNGKPIDSVNRGIELMLKTLRTNPFALETVYLNILSFNTNAFEVRPFSDLLQDQWCSIEAKGQTNFGKGLDILISNLNSHIIKATKELKGDWKPLIFIMTDGRFGDAWKRKLDVLKQSGLGELVICACGETCNLRVLETMGGTLLIMEDISENSILALFRWISSSINHQSIGIHKMNKQKRFSNDFKKIYLSK